jgi:cytochrome P450
MISRWPTYRRPRPIPPGPRGYPWLGILPQMRRDSLGFLSTMVRTYGDIVALPFGPFLVYLLCHPEHVAYVLQDHARNYGKSRFSAQVRPLLGQGLATSDGALWRTQRRLVQPAFHRERLAALAATITTATQAMLAEMTRLTGEVIVRALFGTALPEAVGRTMFADFTTVTGYLRMHMLTLTPGAGGCRPRGGSQCQAAFARLDTLVGQHIQARPQQGEDHGDLLALLPAARDPATGAGMPAQQLRDEVMTLLFAGHETTVLALTWPGTSWRVIRRWRSGCGGTSRRCSRGVCPRERICPLSHTSGWSWRKPCGSIRPPG